MICVVIAEPWTLDSFCRRVCVDNSADAIDQGYGLVVQIGLLAPKLALITNASGQAQDRYLRITVLQDGLVNNLSISRDDNNL